MNRQVIVAAFDGALGLRVIDAPVPYAGPGEVRIRVTAAGLNPVDLRIAEGGATAERFGVTPPYVNGNDFAGIIDEVGAGVQSWGVGDRVYGGMRCRAQSDYVVTAKLSELQRTPANLDDERAAVLDIAARTAWAGIRALDLHEGETVLVTAAAGGCGVLACQFAAQRGARVIGVASARNHDLLSDLGVIPVDYREDLRGAISRHAPGGVNAVFDAFGAEYLDLARSLGVPASRINSVADRAGAEARGMISVGRAATSPAALAPLGQMVADGRLQICIDGTYPVEHAIEAYRRLDEGHVRGKLLLTFS